MESKPAGRTAPIPLADMGMATKRKRPATTSSNSMSHDAKPAIEAPAIHIDESSSHDETEHIHENKKRRIEENSLQSSANNNAGQSNTPPKTDQNGHNSNQNAKRNKKKNKRNKGNTNKVAQSSNQPVQFDYSKVDYSKFQGGSHKERPNTEFKSKFHGKVSS